MEVEESVGGADPAGGGEAAELPYGLVGDGRGGGEEAPGDRVAGVAVGADVGGGGAELLEE